MLVLKSQTSAYHEAIERQMGLLLGAVTQQEYGKLLQRLLGYYLPLEARILALPEWRSTLPEVKIRQKSHLLITDLEHLRVSAEKCSRLPQCERLAEVNSITRALGCQYVLERATLSGQIILRHLREQLGVDAGKGGSFFASFGEKVVHLWSAYEQFVNGYCTLPETQAILVSAACQTFDTMNCWLFPGEQEAKENNVRC